jgi:hypothetical protein
MFKLVCAENFILSGFEILDFPSHFTGNVESVAAVKHRKSKFSKHHTSLSDCSKQREIFGID